MYGGISRGKFNTGVICQNSYVKFIFFFVLLSLCRLNFKFGGVLGELSTGLKLSD